MNSSAGCISCSNHHCQPPGRTGIDSIIMGLLVYTFLSRLSAEDRQISVLMATMRLQLEAQQGEIIAGTTLCNPCPLLCETCVGPSNSECNLCTNASSMGACVESCGPSGECDSSTVYHIQHLILLL